MSCRLDFLVEIRGGGTPSKAVPEFWGGDIPWASVKDFKSSELSKTEDYVTADAIKNSASNLIPAGSIIVPTRMALGKVATNLVDMAINQDLKALIIKDEKKLDKRYFLRFLESKADYLEKQGKGATVKGITLDVLKELEVPLPPLEEQKRIAAILDKADAIRRKRQQAIKLADDFLRSVFLEMFGDPVTNPKGWEVRKLGDVSELINGDRSSNYPSGDDLKECGVLFLNTKNITNGKIELVDPVFITEEKFNSLSRGKLQQDDLVITLRGTLGSCAIFDTEYKTGFINAQLMIIRPKIGITSDFLHAFLTSNQIQDAFQSLGRGAAVPQLTGAQMKELDIYIPNFELMDKFTKIKNTVSDVKFKCNVATKSELFESLSQKAFSGHL